MTAARRRARRLLTVPVTVLLAVAGCSASGADTPTSPRDVASPAPPVSAGPPPVPEPTFADLAHTDTSTVAKLLLFDAKVRVAVVEPTVMLTGDEYCTLLRRPTTDGACQLAYTTVDSRAKITLPISAGATFATVGDGDEKCIDVEMGSGARCPLPLRQFTAWAADKPEALVRVETRGGEIVRLAEVYVP